MTIVKTNNEEPSTIPWMVLPGYAYASLPPLLSSRHPGTISVSSQHHNRPSFAVPVQHTPLHKRTGVSNKSGLAAGYAHVDVHGFASQSISRPAFVT
ncbi:hypothetical protein NXS19_013668 [Fusarium pseudograminearum]|nr:hypothetical protein NXS19_013668 [Fusarium pseudograminearum]